ncbi:MAG: 30S ribosomal protein S3 [Candidatus Marinamargulisbacteria bacterium]
MGQKVNPRALRLKGVQEFVNNWFSLENYGKNLVEDVEIRDFIEQNLKRSFISKSIIRRKGSDKVFVDIHTSKPGVILGKAGESINRFRESIGKKFGKQFIVNVIEEKSPDKSAKLLSELIAVQLEKRIPFRRAMKMVVQSALKAGAEGVQVKCSGRLGGVEIARSEWYQKGRMPLHTIRAKIDYYFTEANTIYGKIGVKVWINNGEVIADKKKKVDASVSEGVKDKEYVNA